MRIGSWLKLAEILVGVAFLVTLFTAWRADRRDRAQLQTQLNAAQQTLAALSARQSSRDAQLEKTLAHLAAEQEAIRTPAQALQSLPSVLPLPSPLQAANTAQDQTRTSPANVAASPQIPAAPAPVMIPTADLKPLYDFASNCKACQAKLAAAQADLADERAKSKAIEKQRDDALHAAKGGSVWRRIGRAAKWFLIGGAAGALAAKVAP
jgi:hypothetical protein